MSEISGELIVAMAGLIFSIVAFMLGPVGVLAWSLFKRVDRSITEHARLLQAQQLENVENRSRLERLVESLGVIGGHADQYMKQMLALTKQTTEISAHMEHYERRLAAQEHSVEVLHEIRDSLAVLESAPSDKELKQMAARRRRRAVRGGVEPAEGDG